MIDIKKHYYNMGNEDINMMLFGDLHYSDKFNDKKLDLIYNKLKNSEYIFIAGDLLDSTDVVNNIDKRDKLIKFLEKVSKKSKVFITLGNHDLAIRNKHKKIKDDNNEFWLEVSKIDDAIFPMYLPSNTSLKSQNTISKDNGERLILTFAGDKPFVLVEETISKSNELEIVPTLGEPTILLDTIGSLSENSASWISNGIEYYIASDVLSEDELSNIAKSISTIPVMK